MLMPSFTSTVLLVDLTGTEIWRGLKAFATTSPRRGLKLESSIVESRVSLRPFISWDQECTPKIFQESFGSMFEADLGKIPLITAGGSTFLHKNRLVTCLPTKAAQVAIHLHLEKTFCPIVPANEFWSIQTDALFPNKKNHVHLEPTGFCCIHTNPSKRPTSEVGRFQSHALCPGSSWRHHAAFWRSPQKGVRNWYGEYPKYPW